MTEKEYKYDNIQRAFKFVDQLDWDYLRSKLDTNDGRSRFWWNVLEATRKELK